MTNQDSILKSRDITLLTKVHPVKAMVFPVVMYGCESWMWRKLSAKELMLLNCGVGEDSRVPWTARRSNQSILKEISPGCSLEGMMLKLKLQYFGHIMQRIDSLEKTLMLGGIEGRRRRGRQRMKWLDGITDSMEWVWVNSKSCFYIFEINSLSVLHVLLFFPILRLSLHFAYIFLRCAKAFKFN